LLDTTGEAGGDGERDLDRGRTCIELFEFKFLLEELDSGDKLKPKSRLLDVGRDAGSKGDLVDEPFRLLDSVGEDDGERDLERGGFGLELLELTFLLVAGAAVTLCGLGV
jgi:hypothetical protein